MKVAIIGVGLIGGSIGLALKDSKIKSVKITGIGRSEERLKLAMDLKAIDEMATDVREGVKDADVVFVCLPVGLIAGTVRDIMPYCKNSAVITDVGSVKKAIIDGIEESSSRLGAKKRPEFLGGHPIAGSEKTSVKYARHDLFRDAAVVLTPAADSTSSAIKKIKNLWLGMGAKVYLMSADEHDRVISYTSHLPHIVAFALVKTVDHLEFAGSSFRDTTRIVSSDPSMWAEIVSENRDNIMRAVEEFKKELMNIEAAGSKEKMRRIFSEAKAKRDRICRH